MKYLERNGISSIAHRCFGVLCHFDGWWIVPSIGKSLLHRRNNSSATKEVLYTFDRMPSAKIRPSVDDQPTNLPRRTWGDGQNLNWRLFVGMTEWSTHVVRPEPYSPSISSLRWIDDIKAHSVSFNLFVHWSNNWHQEVLNNMHPTFSRLKMPSIDIQSPLYSSGPMITPSFPCALCLR